MSFDMSLSGKDDSDVASMNWLRNPFGLRDWIRDNAGIDITPFFPTYDKSETIDRKAALSIVKKAQNMVVQLDKPFFKVSKSSLENEKYPFWAGFDSDMKRLITSWPIEQNDEYIYYFMPETATYVMQLDWLPGGYRCDTGFAYYRKWVDELVAFCQLLQDENLTYYADD